MAGDMGWISQTLGRYICMVRFWNRLVNMSNDRITKKIFLWDKTKQNGWCSEISKIFHTLQLSEYYNSSTSCNLQYCKEKVTNKMSEIWLLEVDSKPKLRTYKSFKTSFGLEKYVFINNRSKRSLSAQFRLGVLPLRIETGRWYGGLALEERTCDICLTGEIEDECHFLIQCNFYTQTRAPLFQKCSALNPNFMQLSNAEKLIFIVKNLERDLANYLLTCWNSRRNYLYDS